MRHRMWIVAMLGLMLSGTCIADTAPFEFDTSVESKDRSRKRHIAVAHQAIKNTTGSREAARLAILRSVTGRAGRIFILEGEGDRHVDARIDYKGNPLWVRVHYSEDSIHVRYLDGLKDFVCENNRDGVCYKTHRHYYKFAAVLRKNIIANLRSL